jgi:cell division topological specificity factor
MNFLSRWFGRDRSAQVAKQRLQVVLIQDRTNISPELLNILKEEIVDVISRHVEIDRAAMQVAMTHTDNRDRLVADIPIRGLRGSGRAWGNTPRGKKKRRGS